jgi:hypothetical protein
LPENKISRLSVTGRDRGMVADLVKTKGKKQKVKNVLYFMKSILSPLLSDVTQGAVFEGKLL